jgi:glycosyltransferase involved in cell wall biosynthesis
MTAPRIAVVIPCHNEAVAIPRVIAGFRAALPNAVIYAYDNNSTDDTVALARAAGACIGTEMLQGKGNVVRRMFADVDADIYVLVDGDDTYDAGTAPAMIEMLLAERLDMVTAVRVSDAVAAYRPAHRPGGASVRCTGDGHALRLSRLLAALRQNLPGNVRRFRDGDGTHRACLATRPADR